MENHDYDLAAFLGASEDGNSKMAEAGKINLAQTPRKSPLPTKHEKGSKTSHDECIGDTLLKAVNTLVLKMDAQNALLMKFEKRIEESSAAVVNKEDINGLQEKVSKLQEENKWLQESIIQKACYRPNVICK